MKKTQAVALLEKLPDDFPVDDLVEKLLFIKSVEKGLKSLDEGRSVTHEEAKKRLNT